MSETTSLFVLMVMAALLTALSVGAAIIMIVRRKEPPQPPHSISPDDDLKLQAWIDRRRKRSRTLLAATAMMLVVVMSLTLLLAVNAQRRAALQAQRPVVAITSPGNGEAVKPGPLEVVGIANNLPEGELIWMLVRPAAVARSYPSPEPCSPPDDARTWRCTIYVGSDPTDRGTRFVITAALADARGSNTLARTPEQGLDQIPLGVQIADEVTVIVR